MAERGEEYMGGGMDRHGRKRGKVGQDENADDVK